MTQLPSFDELLLMSDGEKLRIRNTILDEMLADADPDKQKLLIDTQKKIGNILLKNGEDHMKSLNEIFELMGKSLGELSEAYKQIGDLCLAEQKSSESI